jgi:hypothetical protein
MGLRDGAGAVGRPAVRSWRAGSHDHTFPAGGRGVTHAITPQVPLHECDLVLVSYELLRRELALRGGHGSVAARHLPRLGFWWGGAGGGAWEGLLGSRVQCHRAAR